jgi:hypothetical protein
MRVTPTTVSVKVRFSWNRSDICLKNYRRCSRSCPCCGCSASRGGCRRSRDSSRRCPPTVDNPRSTRYPLDKKYSVHGYPVGRNYRKRNQDVRFRIDEVLGPPVPVIFQVF